MKMPNAKEDNLEKLNLLIIEDDADQMELMRETLEDYFGRTTLEMAW
jgi:hypothetical protein